MCGTAETAGVSVVVMSIRRKLMKERNSSRRGRSGLSAYVTVLCEAFGAPYGDVTVSVIFPVALLRRHASYPLLSEHGGRRPAEVVV